MTVMPNWFVYFIWAFVVPLIVFWIIAHAGSTFGALYGGLIIFGIYILILVLAIMIACSPTRCCPAPIELERR